MYLFDKTKDIKAFFSVSAEGFSGVTKIAGKVANDFKLVTGMDFSVATDEKNSTMKAPKILVATIGNSKALDELESAGRVDLSPIKGKWECYILTILAPAEGEENETLLIAGSDKRGTIYGLFKLSEIIGVSPWVWFADVNPVKKDSIEIAKADCVVSKEPSVKYRGFFINDEWPSFGNWTFEHFNGFTTEMYDHVFELLLRMKGNYLWPAMWTSNFSCDGPGLTNAILADEYGVVMSNSHHEPCLRHSEEWDLIKGEDTPYGTAWNFDRNREGLTNYWRDGLKRNGEFENIITMGMRGERDSEVLGQTATLADNINYLKDVITTQNALIKETISEDLDSTHRMLAIYKEVEKYFHGDETAEGLKNWDGLDGITCMLCEDNFGNLRTLPDAATRNRKGGWGMYYHFDYHGGPVSYEWINSTHLSRTREQMCQAYDFGIKEIWIVNVGDLKPQEYPLSYFLDLAYDIDKWGMDNENAVSEYLSKWVNEQFPELSGDATDIEKLLEGYTRLNYTRKPESLGADTYHPTHYGEAKAVQEKAEALEALAEKLMRKVKGTEAESAFYQLVYYPVAATTNLLKLQLSAGRNHLLANMNAPVANVWADKISEYIKKDRELTDGYHKLNGGKWNGMMKSEHIGFKNWNDEECAYPVKMYVEPANKPGVIVTAGNSEVFTMGGDWTRKKLILPDFLDASCDESFITIMSCQDGAVDCKITCDVNWLCLDKTEASVGLSEKISITIDRQIAPSEISKALVKVSTKFSHVDIEVYAAKQAVGDIKLLPILPESLKGDLRVATNELGLTMEASEAKLSGGYKLIPDFGKYAAGIKAFPTTKTFDITNNAPCAEFTFSAPCDMEVQVDIVTAPGNPVDKGGRMYVGIALNGESPKPLATIGEGYEGGEGSCAEWAKGVMTQQHDTFALINCKKGVNSLKIYAQDPGVVIERVLLRQAGTQWSYGYMGKYPQRIF